jgi:hypothetical protein
MVQSPTGSRRGLRERAGVLALVGIVVTLVAVYLALNAASDGSDTGKGGLLPYQTLAGTLPESDRRTFLALREWLLTAEADRARTSRWPDAAWVVLPGAESKWTRFERGVVTNYLGQPGDPSQPAWLLEIQEPEPGTPPDPAPNDEEHHRLPDGTTLHVYVWTHPFGGQVPAAFVPQPRTSGWTEVFSKAPNPVFAIRR